MGVAGLCNLIEDEVPEAVKSKELKSYFGRRIAVDASIFLYQFLIAIQFSDQESTRILSGIFYRTCKLLENGIKPVFVFDGKPPDMKLETLRKRKEKVAEAKSKLDTLAKDRDIDTIGTSSQSTSSQIGSQSSQNPYPVIDYKVVKRRQQRDAEEIKLSKRTIRIDSKHIISAKTVLRLLGVPVIDAPAEAESFCAQLCKDGLVYGVATEDVDVLVFGAPKMIRHLSSSSTQTMKEIDLELALDGLKLTQEQLVDLSILIGCDYCPSIRGIGPRKGLKLLQTMTCIENILKERYGIDGDAHKDGSDIDSDDSDKEWTAKISELRKTMSKKKTKVPKDRSKDVPENWMYKEARKLFTDSVDKTLTITEDDLKISDPDESGLLDFLCDLNQFDKDRVKKALNRIHAGRTKSTQTRIDMFFKRVPCPPSISSSQVSIPCSSQESSSQSPSTSAKDAEDITDDGKKKEKVTDSGKKKRTKKVTTKRRTKLIRFKTKPSAKDLEKRTGCCCK